METLKYFTMQKVYNLQKNPLKKETKNPSRKHNILLALDLLALPAKTRRLCLDSL